MLCKAFSDTAPVVCCTEVGMANSLEKRITGSLTVEKDGVAACRTSGKWTLKGTDKIPVSWGQTGWP